VAAAFESEMLDACYLAYNEYQSVFCQRATVRQLLPIPPVTLDPTERTDFCYEPSKAALLSQLLPYVAVESHHAFLESVASESAARMVAMDAANKNSTKLVEKLTMRYQRARQHEITNELIERTSFVVESMPRPGFSKWHRELRDGTSEQAPHPTRPSPHDLTTDIPTFTPRAHWTL
jgi:ATP synthase F1 gamma subunit